MERCFSRCLQAGSSNPALVDHIWSTAQRDRDDRLLRDDFRSRHAELHRFLSRLYGCQHRCASYGGWDRRRNNRPRAQPRLRSSLRRSDDHSTDHKRAPDRIQQGIVIGASMAETIFNSPATSSTLSNLELAIVQSVAAFFVLLSFVIAAAMLLLTLIETYLVVGGGIILLGFGANRFTAPAAEGYFGYVIKVGVRLLFFYLVLALGVMLANDWNTALIAACKPTPMFLPWFGTYGSSPSSLVTMVCANTVPAAVMLDVVAKSIVFAIVTIAVPHIAASIAGGTAGLALSHAFEAAYIAQTVVRPITSALQTGLNKVAQIGNAGIAGNGEATGWVKAMDFGRQTQQLGNLGPDGGQRVPAPKDVRGTSVMPSRAPNTTPMNPGTARYGNGNSTTTMGKATSKI